VTRIITPFDTFVIELVAWINSAWFVWVALALTVAAVVAGVIIARVRARARDRIPQYRRLRS
jgi:heme exporter protein D